MDTTRKPAATPDEAMPSGAPAAPLTLTGGRVLHADGTIAPARVTVADGRIAAVEPDAGPVAGRHLDLGGRLLLPGIVDLHGDAVEHFLMPRSGVPFPVDLALAEVDRQLVANGITTAFHSITYSWEPGLRGRETVVAVMEALEAMAPGLACDTLLHVRHELHNVDAEADLLAWLAAGRIRLLSLNEHLDMIAGRLERVDKVAQYSERSGLAIEAYKALVQRVGERGPEVPGSLRRICDAAATAGIPIASHDDETPAMRGHYRGLGAGLCEFPCNAATAEAAAAAGEPVILGSPNIVRGGSHDGRLTAEETVRAGTCSVLTSDYYYPAVLVAPFQLAERGACSFAAAWDLVAGGPARAVGLQDRGRIAVGNRADLIAVDDGRPDLPRVAATLTHGRLVHLADQTMLA